jgi:hypothetical protein
MHLFTLSTMMYDCNIFLFSVIIVSHLGVSSEYRSISSSQVAHDTPKASECLYPVIHIEQVEPF